MSVLPKKHLQVAHEPSRRVLGSKLRWMQHYAEQENRIKELEAELLLSTKERDEFADDVLKKARENSDMKAKLARYEKALKQIIEEEDGNPCLQITTEIAEEALEVTK